MDYYDDKGKLPDASYYGRYDRREPDATRNPWRNKMVTVRKPVAKVEQSFEFDADLIKQILADYVSQNYGVDATPHNVSFTVSEADFHGYSSSPARATFTVRVKR